MCADKLLFSGLQSAATGGRVEGGREAVPRSHPHPGREAAAAAVPETSFYHYVAECFLERPYTTATHYYRAVFGIIPSPLLIILTAHELIDIYLTCFLPVFIHFCLFRSSKLAVICVNWTGDHYSFFNSSHPSHFD